MNTNVPILQPKSPLPPKPGYRRGPSFRIGRVMHVLDYLPPFTIKDTYGVTAYSCGKCFRKLGDDPIGGRPGTLTPGAPKGTTCTFCGHAAWPYGV